MKIDRRLTMLGVMLVVLSMTMATQYATTRVTYSYAIVHPSNSDIRFIGSDNSSNGGVRVLRVSNNASGSKFVTMELGNWSPNQEKNYTAAFAIVNEEPFPINITYVNISGVRDTYIDIWVHGNRSTDIPDELNGDLNGDGPAATKASLIIAGVAQGTSASRPWKLAAGDGDPSTMNTGAGGGGLNTPWDQAGANVRYSISNEPAVNETSDFVWVCVSIDIPSTGTDVSSATGGITFHFQSETA